MLTSTRMILPLGWSFSYTGARGRTCTPSSCSVAADDLDRAPLVERARRVRRARGAAVASDQRERQQRHREQRGDERASAPRRRGEGASFALLRAAGNVQKAARSHHRQARASTWSRRSCDAGESSQRAAASLLLARMARLAAIDIGSNALQLRIVEVDRPLDHRRMRGARATPRFHGRFATSSSIACQRAPRPRRRRGRLATSVIGAACDALRRFRAAMDVAKVDRYRAVATSAAREAARTATSSSSAPSARRASTSR